MEYQLTIKRVKIMIYLITEMDSKNGTVTGINKAKESLTIELDKVQIIGFNRMNFKLK